MAEVHPDGQPENNKAMASKSNARGRNKDGSAAKRKCVSTACIACRRRKSKCDGNLPSCAACASVYGTECVYDPNSDHRRKGVYKKGVDSSKTQDSTLRILIEGILNCHEHEVLDLVKQIRTCESLEDVAQGILARSSQGVEEEDEDTPKPIASSNEQEPPRFERELSGKLGEVRLENGAVQFLGGTSNLLYVDNKLSLEVLDSDESGYASQEDAIQSWTTVTDDTSLILHLVHMYFTWHYTYFTTLSRSLFFRDFLKGRPQSPSVTKTAYCTRLLVNAMLALGCHFTSWPASRSNPEDSSTAGDHFFKECKRLIVNNEEYEHARITTVQALALMSVREAGCGREAKGWIYSGMSFRMAMDLGLPYESSNSNLPEEEVDARRMTFWGCYLFDKCWSNYLGRPPQLGLDNITIEKFDVFPLEDSDVWSPWTDSGLGQANVQPSRTRAIALQISALCEISSDLLLSFYKPNQVEKPLGKQAELKKLSELHTRLEAWKRDLPKEFEAKEGQLPQVLIMHMFFYLLFIHLFRPFLKYTQSNTPLPAHVSPRRHCTSAAASISKLLRLYKKTHGLRQICNIAVYIAHSACTIHLLNLQDKDARRDLAHGLRHLEEISECWLCARRTLSILHHQVRKWDISLPEEVQEILDRVEVKYAISKLRHDNHSDTGSPTSEIYHHVPVLTGLAAAETIKQPHTTTTTTTTESSQTVDGSVSNNTAAGSHPSIRIRSPSSLHRTELLRQMKQNSLQTQASPTHYDFPALVSTTGQRRWHDDVWEADSSMHVNATSPNESSSLLSLQQPQPPQTVGLPSPNKAISTFPAATFASELQVPHNIFDEQRDWWFRDQSSLFDNWAKREGMSAGSPNTSNSGVNNTTDGQLMNINVCAGPTDTSRNSRSTFSGVRDDIQPLGWEQFQYVSR